MMARWLPPLLLSGLAGPAAVTTHPAAAPAPPRAPPPEPNPDTGSECMPAGVRLSADQMNGTSSLVPTFHPINNVSLMADGLPQLENLNDANAIFRYRGLWHLMNQAGGGGWAHSVSEDLVHWYHLANALGKGPANSTWDENGPCDGTISFPDLGRGPPFDGSSPVLLYGPDCGKPVAVAAAGGVGASSGLGDAPRVEVALPQDPADPYLTDWVKTQPGPAVFDGTPCKPHDHC